MKCQTIEVWKVSARLLVNVYKTLEQCKQWGFKDQITRACLSIPSNIAEGMEKESHKEQARYLEISKGSAAEFATQTYIGIEIGYIEKQTGQEWIKQTNQILSMLTNLKKKVKK
ncbi:MAG: four helix bundle protein [Gammaproteobacteria bacterium]|nr:four helix bundle protein [Gammaproteobacteria bacterium]